MIRLFPRFSHSNLRVFLACLLSFMTLIAPIASVAAATRNDSRAPSSSNTDAKSEPTAEEKLESYLFSNPAAAPAATPDITATKAATFTDSDGDNKAELGETITYNVNVANAGPGDATNVTFTDTIDPNTTFVPGSLKVSPLAFADTYVTPKNTPLNTSAPGVLANDTGTPAPTVSKLNGSATLTGSTTGGGTVTIFADGHFNYTPNPTFEGADTFTYTVTNGQSPDDTATVTINVDAAPTVTATTPVNGATGVTTSTAITVTFSESVSATASAFSIQCPVGTPITFTQSASPATTFTLTPTSPLPSGVTCTVNVDKDEISDTDSFDPPDNMAADYTFSFSTDAAPEVTTTLPTNGAPSVAANVNITVNFSEAVTANTSAFTLECPTGTGKTFTLSGSGTSSLTLDPTADLPFGTLCTVTVIGAQIHDLDANDPPDTMVGNYAFSFTIDSPPAVTTTSPTNGATDVAGNANITVNFSEPVNVTASAFTIQCPVGSPVTYTLSPVVPGASSSFTLDPTVTLPGGVTCTVTVVANQVTDTDTADPPDQMLANYVFSFTIDSAPSVTTTSPVNGATNVASNANIIVNFSESVNVTASAFTLECPVGTPTAFTLTPAVPGPASSYTLNPNADLPFGVTCTVTVVAAQVTDNDANDPPDNMVANYVFSFTVDSPPSVTATTPTNGATGVLVTTNIDITFSEGVDATTSSFTIQCPTGSGNQAYALSNNAGKTVYTLNPTANLPAGAICTVTVIANQISDTDAGDPPDNMLADYVFTFKIPPVANADTYPQTVIGNVNINSANIPYSVVTNDLYAAADPVTITKVDAATTVVTNTITVNTAQGGTVVMIVSGADIGKFTYNPPAGYEGNDAFTYEITNGGGSATATVTIPIAGMVWFINNNSPTCTTRVNGCGRLTNPYSDLGSFNAENNGIVGALNPAVNDNIFIYESATAYNNGVTLLTGQRLIGQDSTSSLSTLTGLNPPSGSAPFPAMNSGNATITKITTGSGAGITLNSTGAAGTNTVNGLTVGNTAGAGIQGLNSGTVTIADVSINEPSSTRTGQALFLDGQANTLAVTATFINVTSSSSATNNVSLVRTTGTINLGTGALSGSTGNAFNVSGAGNTATISYAGTITNSTSRAVNIQNKTGGTVTFSGLITSTGSGIFLDTNTGTTMNFTGGVNLNGANAGFTATNGGTVSVTDPNANGTAPDNTINATSVTGLNVANTTIGAGGLNFRSISSGNNTAAADPASGIILNNTGASGSLIVSGSNNASVGGDDSGGTIQNTTSFGISLTNTLSPSFTNVKVDTTAGSGVKGTTVTNFTFKNGKVLNSNNGSIEASDESNIGLNISAAVPSGTENNVSGVVTITNNTLTNALYHGVDINNYNGTISDAQISGNSITSTTSAATSLGSGIRLIANGSATTVANVTKATLNGNTILNFPAGAGILAFGGNGNTAGGAPAGVYGTAGDGFLAGDNVINITNNTIQGQNSANKMGTFAIQANVNGRGQGNFNITGNGTVANPIRDILGNVISHSATGVTNVTSLISNNVIVANHQAGFGGPLGISVGAGQVTGIGNTAHLSVSITGNNVSQTDGFGIQGAVREGLASLDITIKNNTVAAPLGGVRGGIRVDAGGGASDIDNPVCLDISGNTSGANNVNTSGINLRKEGNVATTHDFGIEGMAATSTPGVEQYVGGLNPGSQASADGRPSPENRVLLLSGTAGFTNCNTAPVGMYKFEKTQRFETARANEATKPATKLGEQAAPAEKLFISKDEAITHHDNTAVTAPKPAIEKVAQPVALRSKTSDIVKTAKAQPMAQPVAQTMAQTPSSRSTSQVFTSHATSSKAKAQPAASNSFLSTAMSPLPPDIDHHPIGTIPAGKSVTISFQVTVKTAGTFTGTSPQVSNQGTVEADNPNGGTITVLTDDTTVGGANNPTVTPVDSQPDLQITKTDGAIVAVPGGTITYTLAYNNTNGKRDANNTVITETIPANTVFNAGASDPSWSCPGGTSAGNTCTLAVGSIPAGGAGGSAIFAVTVVNPLPAGVTGISNTATIADDGLFGVDGNPLNNTSTVLTSVNAAINLTISKSDGNTGSTPGQNITYTLTYSNTGNKGATGVVINETVPANTTFNAGASTAGWSCAAITAGSACTFPVGPLAGGGAGGSVAFTVTVDNPVPGGTTQISNTATITDDGTNGADADTGNNTSTDTTPFDAPPTIGTYSDTSLFVTQGTTVTPTAPPADDKPGFTVGVAAPGFTGGISVNQTTGVVTITNAGPASGSAYTVTVTVTDSIGQMTVRTFQLTVSKSDTTTTVTSSHPTLYVGQNVTYTATVTSNTAVTGPPTGTVDFFDGGNPIATCTGVAVNGSGQATCSQTYADTVGSPHSITATYSGDAAFNTSTSSALSQTVSPSLSLTVNTLGDAADLVLDGNCDTDAGTAGDQCTLRAAIQETNFVPTPDTIGFSLPASSTITLNTALDAINGDVTINGPGAGTLTVKRSTVGGTPDFRIFAINSGKTVNISGLTVNNGNIVGDNGGGILNQGTLTLSGMVVNGNNAPSNSGGGIYTTGALTINGSTVSGNSSNQGGGIYSSTSLTITDSTISGNTTLNQGGGIVSFGTTNITNSTVSGNNAALAGGGISANPGTLTLTNVTVTNNRADSDNNGTGAGGGITVSGGPTAIVILHNTIVAGNFNENGVTDSNDDINGAVDAAGSFNLIGDGTGMTGITHGSNGNQIGTVGTPIDARLGPLGNNGGATQTHALLSGSPALDAGNDALVTNPPFNAPPFTDQRGTGFNRQVDGPDANTTATVDIGAFEAQVSVSNIGDTITNEDTAAVVNFNTSSNVTNASISVTSSNTTLVPNANIVVSGTSSPFTLTITPAANLFGTTTITVTVTVGGQTMTDDFVLTVNPVPDQPSVTGGSTSEDTITPPGQLVISRNAADGSEVSHFQITGITGGTLYQANGTTQITNGQFITFAQGNAGLRFLPAPNSVANGSFTVQGSIGNVIASGPTATATITVSSVNDQPTLNAITPNPLNILEDAGVQNVSLSGITDGGAEGQTLVVTATSNNTGLIPNPTVTYTSPNTTGSISFTPVANASGTADITVTVNDNGGGTQTISRTFTVNVTAVNDVPSFTKGPDQTVGEDAGAQTVNPWATAISAGTGDTGQTVNFQVTGNTNSALFSVQPSVSPTGVLTYTPAANTSGTAAITIVLKDNGGTTNGGVDTSAPQTFNITVNAVNDAPQNTVPGPQNVNKNGSLTFNAANSNLISIADIDAGTNPVRVTLTATNGRVTLSGTTGLSFTVGDGTSDTTMTFTGTITNINNALNGLVFEPTNGYDGPATLQIVTNDQGNTGSGGALSDTDTINITVIQGGILAFSSATYTVNEAAGTATITVNRTGGSNGTTKVDYTTSNGTATAGQDYTTASGQLTFNNGVTTQTFTVPITSDALDEADETINLTLSNVTGSGDLGSPATAVLTITDDDPQPSLSINDATVTEGNSGTTNAVFTVTLSAVSGQTVTVNYQTADGTATVANNDYTAIPSTVLTFLPGETTKTITVLVKGDTNAEANETFFVNLSGAVNATITDNQGQGTITSDDTPLIGLSSSTYSVTEDGLHATITVNRLGDLSQPARADYLTSDPSGLNLCSQFTGNASSRCDYATTAGTLRFAAGETSKTIYVPIVDDVYLDGPEVFTLTLSNPVGGDLSGITSATITIIDNDTAPAANPIDNDAFFIRQLYIDFLGREPEPGAVNAWLGILNHCAIPTDCDRIAVAQGFVRSPEFQTRGFFVYRTFKTLGRIAHYNEFIPDMAKLSGFLSPADLEANKAAYIQEFMNRTEFKTLYDPTIGNPTAYVDKLLQSVQLPGHPGRAGWIAGLTNGSLTREQVLRQLIESGELYTAYVNEAFIIMNYFGFLRRDADASYLTWIDIFNHTNDDRIIINGFLNSLEYRLRFGPN
jgi:large repetitive protein